MINKVIRPERIIQFGEGGFLRGFADWILQILNEKTDFNGSAVVVQPIEQGLCDKLSAQDCVYTHVMRGMQGGKPTVETKVIDVISRCIKPYDDYAAYMALAEDPDLRFVISNTTESGISYHAGDKPTDCPPVSFPAKVAALLHKRYKLGLDGFIFLPCELIDKNGDNLKRIVLQYAKEWGLEAGFAAWVERENIFCNTLVDRIVTGYPKDEDLHLGYEDGMLNTSELFHLWVIEGPREALLKELPFDRTGLNIIITDNLEMYRTRKVRILNGAHTAMVPYALLEGFDTVKSCMEDERMLAFVKACVFDEIIPTLDLPRQELEDYANNVLERFNNPFIKHYLTSIALNSVSKFKVRVLPSILEYIRRRNEMPQKLLFSFAQLIRFYKTGAPNDDAAVMEFMKNASVREILANTALWDQDLSFLHGEVAKWLQEG